MPTRRPVILVVDDDPRLLKLVSRTLEIDGYDVITVGDGKSALRLIEDEEPALVILDIMMPGPDGFEVCEGIRNFTEVPIVMLTAKSRVEDVVHGLDIGADDYITKPFAPQELLTRIKAVLRRTRFPEEMPQAPFVSGDLYIDFAQRRVAVAGEEVVLSPTEYKILCLLARDAGKVITHGQLLSQVWGTQWSVESHSIQVAVARLRRKIGDDATNPKYIVTKAGIGYVLKAP